MYAYFNIYRIAFSPHVGFFAGWGNEHIFGYLEDSPPPPPPALSQYDDRERDQTCN